MKYRTFLIVACIVLSCSCKTAEQKTTLPPGGEGTSNPMSCKVHGQVIKIYPPLPAGQGTCSQYPCYADVRIIDISDCGSSVALAVNTGDTIKMKFEFTLNNTKEAFPNMKAQYPGLKQGSRFTSWAEYRMRPASGGEFVVYGYDPK